MIILSRAGRTLRALACNSETLNERKLTPRADFLPCILVGCLAVSFLPSSTNQNHSPFLVAGFIIFLMPSKEDASGSPIVHWRTFALSGYLRTEKSLWYHGTQQTILLE